MQGTHFVPIQNMGLSTSDAYNDTDGYYFSFKKSELGLDHSM